MNNQELLNVAKTIKSQIHSTILMCAAARNYAAYEDKSNLYGLQFTISNTSAVKYGTVRITLNGSDTYDITIKNKIAIPKIKYPSPLFLEADAGTKFEKSFSDSILSPATALIVVMAS